MDAELRPTVASEIALPVRIVELRDLVTTSGEPVRVRCERRDQLFISEQFGLPGARPMAALDDGEATRQQNAKRLLAAAPGLIHSATAFIKPDGALIRPAFHCDEAHAVPGSISWDLMSLEDKLRVLATLMELGGFGGAAEARFSAPDGAGSGDGLGAVAGGEGDVDVAASGAD